MCEAEFLHTCVPVEGKPTPCWWAQTNKVLPAEPKVGWQTSSSICSSFLTRQTHALSTICDISVSVNVTGAGIDWYRIDWYRIQTIWTQFFITQPFMEPKQNILPHGKPILHCHSHTHVTHTHISRAELLSFFIRTPACRSF